MALLKRKSVRIELLDVAKAFTIFLVILGHTTSNTDTIMYRRVLYAFHMPLFFFLAGMSTKPRPARDLDKWHTFLKKNTLALFAPFVVWGLIYGPFSFANFPDLFYASWQSLTRMGTLTSLWYLPAFFLARVIAQAATDIIDRCGRIENYPLFALAAVLSFAIGLIMPPLEMGYPLCLNVAFVGAGFILLGIALRIPLLIFAISTEITLALAFIASIALLYLGTVARGDACDLVLMCAARYGNLPWFFVNSAAGTMAVLTFSMLLIRMAHECPKPFSLGGVSFVGMHTMGIFLLHKPMLQELFMPLFMRITPGPQLAAAVLASLVTLPASMALCVLVERYIPEMLGQFPNYPSGITAPETKATEATETIATASSQS